MNSRRRQKRAAKARAERNAGYIVGGSVAIVGIILALGASKPAADFWASASADKAQLWGNVWVDTVKSVTEDERQSRTATISDVKIDGYPVTINPADAKMVQCWRGNGEVIASFETLRPTGELPEGQMQISVTPDQWVTGLPPAKADQQRDHTNVPSAGRGHGAFNYTAKTNTATYYGQLRSERIADDTVDYRDNTWTIKASLYSPVNSTAHLTKIEATINCPSGR